MPLENLTIRVNRIVLIAGFHLNDGADFTLGATEQDMQDAILTEPSIVEPGLRVMDFEKRVEPGFVDVYGVDSNGNTVVIEIKKDPAGLSAVRQLEEYLKHIPVNYGRKVRPIIVAPSMSKGVQPYMSKKGIEFKPLTLQRSLEVLKKRTGKDQKQLRRWLEQVTS
jgi:RecB family endonuclease NucS